MKPFQKIKIKRTDKTSSPDFNEFMDAMIHKINEGYKNGVKCKDCKHAEIQEVFAICRNPLSEAFGTPVRLTTTCCMSEKK